MKVNIYWKIDVYKFERFHYLFTYAQIGPVNLSRKVKYPETESTGLLRYNTWSAYVQIV